MNALQKIKINKEEIFFRPHPNQSYYDSEKNWLGCGGLQKNILHSEEFDILQIISETKLGIFDLSSTIIEAAELGIDILFSSINKPHKLQGLPMFNHFSNSRELDHKLKKWISGCSYKFSKKVIDYFSANNGNKDKFNIIFKEVFNNS